MIMIRKKIGLYLLAIILLFTFWINSGCFIVDEGITYSILECIIYGGLSNDGVISIAGLITSTIGGMWNGVLGATVIAVPVVTHFQDENQSGNIRLQIFRKGRRKYFYKFVREIVLNTLGIYFSALILFTVFLIRWIPFVSDEAWIFGNVGECCGEMMVSIMAQIFFYIAMSVIAYLIIMLYDNLYFCLSAIFVVSYLAKDIFVNDLWALSLGVIVFSVILCWIIWKCRSIRI